MNLLAAFSAVCCAVSLLYYAAASVIALRFARRASSGPAPLPKVAPRVAVLKPLHGADDNLPENLISYLELDYPKVEYIFGVSDYDDEAAAVVVGLKPQYPFRQITLAVGEEPGCANRKIAKLIGMAERPVHAEIFLLSDADVSVERDHLRRVVSELGADEQIGLVTCLYRAKASGSLASRLGALFINTDFVPLVMISKTIEPLSYSLGATVAIKRQALEAIGGFQRLKDLLADDYYLGKRASDRGYKIRLSNSVVTVKSEERRFAEVWNRQVRWVRTYRTTRPISIATIVLHGPFWALVLLAAARCSIFALSLFAAVVVARIVTSRLIIGKVLGLTNQLSDAWLVPLKDLVMTAVWAASLFSNEVLWGTRRLRIQSDGTMREFFTE
ncbi:MAG: bacteriohopanetetrol glucosamine biosynthesis glycosyltransferase HpnI [Deltaproteobacteria bacterium]|nr:bacteriohopanetetrol glucosamine biosynthesis glycosyltransferase HpnI [Deltaproteobacteria bacterium]